MRVASDMVVADHSFLHLQCAHSSNHLFFIGSGCQYLLCSVCRRVEIDRVVRDPVLQKGALHGPPLLLQTGLGLIQPLDLLATRVESLGGNMRFHFFQAEWSNPSEGWCPQRGLDSMMADPKNQVSEPVDLSTRRLSQVSVDIFSTV